MTKNLRELNRTVNDAVNLIIKKACEETIDGRYIAEFQGVFKEICATPEDGPFLQRLILAELTEREEILQVTGHHDSVELLCNGRYCSHYEWQEDSQELLGISQETWALSSPRKSEQPLDASRMAEIGEIALRALLSENREKAELLLVEACQATAEELTRLGLDAERILDMERNELPETPAEEIEAEAASSPSAHEWLEAKLQSEANYRRYASKYMQEGAGEESAETQEISANVQDALSEFSDEDTFKQPEENVKSTDEAREEAVLSILYNDNQYRVYKDESSALLDKYVEDYKAIASWQLPRRGGRYMIRGDAESPNRGQSCTILEETVLDGSYAYKVEIKNTSSLSDNGIQRQETVKYDDLMQNSENDFIAGRWRIHVIRPGDVFGEEEDVINNQESLVEFWDLLPGIEVGSTRPLSPEQKRIMARGPRIRLGQGRCTGVRYKMSNILQSFQASESSEFRNVSHGLQLMSKTGEKLIVTAAEMGKILYWLMHRPHRNETKNEARGEIILPFECAKNDAEAEDYVKKLLSKIHSAENIEITSIAFSETSVSVGFSFTVSLTTIGIEKIVRVLFSGCDVDIKVSPARREAEAPQSRSV